MYDWDKNKRETFIRKEIKLQCDVLLMVLHTQSHLLMRSDSYKKLVVLSDQFSHCLSKFCFYSQLYFYFGRWRKEDVFNICWMPFRLTVWLFGHMTCCFLILSLWWFFRRLLRFDRWGNERLRVDKNFCKVMDLVGR